MGLNMYLIKKVYVGANYKHNEVTGGIDLKTNKESIKANLAKVVSIYEDAGYWRKANQIHKWFVDNIQEGYDDCGRHYVDYEQLFKLKELCEKTLSTEDSSLLPPMRGFFFGSTEINEYYFKNLENTISIINNLDPDGEYYYECVK